MGACEGGEGCVRKGERRKGNEGGGRGWEGRKEKMLLFNHPLEV